MGVGMAMQSIRLLEFPLSEIAYCISRLNKSDWFIPLLQRSRFKPSKEVIHFLMLKSNGIEVPRSSFFGLSLTCLIGQLQESPKYSHRFLKDSGNWRGWQLVHCYLLCFIANLFWVILILTSSFVAMIKIQWYQQGLQLCVQQNDHPAVFFLACFGSERLPKLNCVIDFGGSLMLGV